MATIPGNSLSKSTYLVGCQCPKRLWLSTFAPDLGTLPGAAAVAIMEAGSEIGRQARALFPGGVLVVDGPHDVAVARTRAHMADPSVPAIFEAAFAHEGVCVRVDVLERLPEGAWGIREVKSGTRVKDVHLDDVALQRFVLEGAGLAVGSVEIVHLDGTYVRGEGAIDWQRIFRRVDVTTTTGPAMRDVPARLAALGRVLGRPHVPPVEPDRHCFSPFQCDFWAHCTEGKPDDWVVRYLRARPRKLDALRAAGIERLVDVPDDFGLPLVPARARQVARSGATFVSPDLGRVLVGLGPPADYLDFETVNPAVPLYPGTRVYQHIPFQWSLHRVDASGRLTHHAFLAEGATDPRREFIVRLLASLGGEGPPIVVYSSFEKQTLETLAGAFPDLAPAIHAVIARLRDLLPVVRRHVYHASFRGSFSIKAVAPALVPGFGYDDLGGVTDGATASATFMRLAAGGGAPGYVEALRDGLLAYCARDTQALVEVHRALIALGGGGGA